jgi:hypothetical protein
MNRVSIFSIAFCLAGTLIFGYVSWSGRLVAGAAGGAQIILYEGEDFTGNSVTLGDTCFDLPVHKNASSTEEFNWNDEVRSIVIVKGTWRLYQNGRCNTLLDDSTAAETSVKGRLPVGGWSTLISATSRGPLRIPNVAAGGIWRDVSSVELVSDQNLPDWALDFRK